MCTEGPRRHHGRARKSCVFLCDLHPVRAEYILKSVSGAACDFYVWNAQGLKIYIASTLHVGLGCSVAPRGRVRLCGENSLKQELACFYVEAFDFCLNSPQFA